jgi:hypothetical protein
MNHAIYGIEGSDGRTKNFVGDGVDIGGHQTIVAPQHGEASVRLQVDRPLHPSVEANGIQEETEPGFLLDVVEHIALSRKNSEKSLDDLELRSECQESSCTECVMTDDALEELLMLFSKQTPIRTQNPSLCTRDASIPLESGNEQIRKTLSPESWISSRRSTSSTISTTILGARLVRTSKFRGVADKGQSPEPIYGD